MITVSQVHFICSDQICTATPCHQLLILSIATKHNIESSDKDKPQTSKKADREWCHSENGSAAERWEMANLSTGEHRMSKNGLTTSFLEEKFFSSFLYYTISTLCIISNRQSRNWSAQARANMLSIFNLCTVCIPKRYGIVNALSWNDKTWRKQTQIFPRKPSSCDTTIHDLLHWYGFFNGFEECPWHLSSPGSKKLQTKPREWWNWN